MPELKPVAGVAKVTVKGVYSAGAATANIFHVDRAEFESGPWTQAEIDAMVTAFRSAFATRFLPVIANAWTMGSVDAVDLTSDTGVVGTAGGSNVGTGTGTALPYNVAQCITWKISRHYRGGHPRTYLPAPGSTMVTGGNSWTTGHQTAVRTAATNFRTDINGITIGGDTCRLTAVHRYRGYTVNPINGKKTPTQLDVPLKSYITGAEFDIRVDSQRRRLGPDK